MTPYFSIIIPMYNRERFIGRAINSCLRQAYENFELIIVDDGSLDKSVDIVKGYVDNRIKLICHDVNRGVGPARNTGVSVATGKWVVFFDSDDELLPEALSTIYRRSIEVDENVSRMLFMGQVDTGQFSPDPPLKEEFWDFITYIKWMESVFGRRGDSLPILRRVTFNKVRFYNDKTLEGPYHLDFMKQFNAMSFPDVIALYHQDANNQLTKPNMIRAIENSLDQVKSGEISLKNHGEALKKYAPRIYKSHISGLATLCFLSGNRVKGIKYSIFSLTDNFFSPKNWGILLFGLMGPIPLAWMKSFRSSILILYKRGKTIVNVF